MPKIKLSSLVARRKLNTLGVASQSTSEMLLKFQTSTSVSLDEGNCSVRKNRRESSNALFVPVVSSTGKPLMPCHPARARELIRKGKAVCRFSKGVFYIRLLDREDGEVQVVAVGIDPGGKKEGYSVKSASHTFLNINADAVTWVKKAVETKRNMKRSRRQRKTPCRSPRFNRARGGIPPSTKARWQWKLRLSSWLSKIYPIECFVVEDIKARTKGKRRWDQSFSPLEVGKKWFYSELSKLGRVELKLGYETAKMRDDAGLKKTKSKLDNVFSAHCVDSWVLANWYTGGHIVPDFEKLLLITPLRFHRRQLHVLQPNKGGIRKLYGSTRSLGLKRGSLVKHQKYGVCYVGGSMNDTISLHSLQDGTRLCQNAKVEDCKFLTYNSWRMGNSSAA